jgi:hypothetical protein
MFYNARASLLQPERPETGRKIHFIDLFSALAASR